jgi:hypothetical protein
MESDEGKYKKVIELLKSSTPDLGSTYLIGQKVLDRILGGQRSESSSQGLLNVIFGWTSVSWVRRSLIAASVFLVLLFIIQQSLIIREITSLNSRIGETVSGGFSGNASYVDRQVFMYNMASKKLPFTRNDLSDKKINDLLKSIDRLENDYHELKGVIESDPELKKLIEKRLSEINDSKIKL